MKYNLQPFSPMRERSLSKYFIFPIMDIFINAQLLSNYKVIANRIKSIHNEEKEDKFFDKEYQRRKNSR